MNKTLIALLTAASFLTLGTAQAAGKPMDKPAAEAAGPAKDAAAKPAKKAAHGKKQTKKHARKAEGAAK